jgi:hypothetical protein
MKADFWKLLVLKGMEEQEQHIGSEVNKVRWVGDDIDNIARNQDQRFAQALLK